MLSVPQKVSGNAAKSGISPGDTVVYTSSFFGDELWPSDALSFTQSALKAAPSPVTLVFVRPAHRQYPASQIHRTADLMHQDLK